MTGNDGRLLLQNLLMKIWKKNIISEESECVCAIRNLETAHFFYQMIQGGAPSHMVLGVYKIWNQIQSEDLLVILACI